MKLERIGIKNFKILKSTEVIFSGFDVLVGVNNSGKTALQQALLWSDYIIRSCVWVDKKSIRCRNKTDYRIDLIPYDSPPDLWTNKRVKNSRTEWGPIEFRLTFNDSKNNKMDIVIQVNNYYGGFHYRVNLEQRNSFKVKEFDEYLKNSVLYIPSATGIVSKEEYHAPGIRNFYLSTGLGGQTIRSSLYDFTQSIDSDDTWQNLINRLKELFKTSKIDIYFDPKKDQYVRALYSEKTNQFEFVSAGSGFHQFISIFSRIMIENPRLILLDEPDAHLNPMLIKGLMDALRKWRTDMNCEVIIATHSRDVINACHGHEIHIFDEGKLLPVSEDIMEEAYHVLGISREKTVQIAEFRKVFLYEGKSDHNVLLRLAGILRKDFDIIAQKIFTLPIRGKDGFYHYVNFFNSLSQQLGFNINLFFLRDRDLMADNVYTELLQTYRKKVKESYILSLNELESYLILYRPLASVLKKKYAVDYTKELHDSIIKNFIEEFTYNWETDFENSYARDSNKPIGDTTTRSEAKKEYSSQKMQNPLKIIDAKKCIHHISKKIKDTFMINVHVKNEILSNLEPDDINPEIKEIINSLIEFAGD